jgi:serine/threonine-protein kinase
MLAGLEAAHGMGVVHRDLKPGNVFLAREGGFFSVKLLDFGIAKVMDAAGGMGTKTRTGALLGTPAYMSPEQVKSAKDVDARSDLWSVGVMFYEMLSGRVAFAAPTEYARLAAVLSAEPPAIQSIDPGLAIAAPFLERALAKDRDHRFQSAREMADAVAALAQPESAMRPAFAITANREGPATAQAAPAREGAREGGAWSLVTEKTPYPAAPEPETLVSADHSPREVLGLSVLAGPGGSTLASPKRDSVPQAPPATPSRAVVVVPTGAIPVAPKASLAPDAEPEGRSGVALPVVVGLVALAFAAGFTLGVLYGR